MDVSYQAHRRHHARSGARWRSLLTTRIFSSHWLMAKAPRTAALWSRLPTFRRCPFSFQELKSSATKVHHRRRRLQWMLSSFHLHRPRPRNQEVASSLQPNELNLWLILIADARVSVLDVHRFDSYTRPPFCLYRVAMLDRICMLHINWLFDVNWALLWNL